ncbi:uncharacterized protein LOC133861971 isoform X2 [Alnus glutinosa]|uniref:uncharacterized protein LOC133861971 isoform X2 n=1 Tax=Alnus glutinosa TaxID=3517 RepID=UPI002D7789B3|nr:uncharacterized protein LOC133861971 isoform X2 [Alnus glutinosa]
MGIASRVLLVFPRPSLNTAPLRFKSVTAPYSSSPTATSRLSRMATEATPSSSSSSSVTAGHGINSPANGETVSSPASSAIDFLFLCHSLKTTKRAGWLRKEIKDPESIADHMYRMGLMALIAPDIPGVQRDKCVKMAIVHDIAEDGISKAEKSRREREALDHMCKLLGGGSRAQEIGELWLEYEENSSPEAKIVKDLDKVEMILQALEYENEQGKDLEEFFQSTAGKFQTELGKAWALEITSRRRKEG